MDEALPPAEELVDMYWHVDTSIPPRIGPWDADEKALLSSLVNGKLKMTRQEWAGVAARVKGRTGAQCRAEAILCGLGDEIVGKDDGDDRMRRLPQTSVLSPSCHIEPLAALHARLPLFFPEIQQDQQDDKTDNSEIENSTPPPSSKKLPVPNSSPLQQFSLQTSPGTPSSSHNALLLEFSSPSPQAIVAASTSDNIMHISSNSGSDSDSSSENTNSPSSSPHLLHRHRRRNHSPQAIELQNATPTNPLDLSSPQTMYDSITSLLIHNLLDPCQAILNRADQQGMSDGLLTVFQNRMSAIFENITALHKELRKRFGAQHHHAFLNGWDGKPDLPTVSTQEKRRINTFTASKCREEIVSKLQEAEELLKQFQAVDLGRFASYAIAPAGDVEWKGDEESSLDGDDDDGSVLSSSSSSNESTVGSTRRQNMYNSDGELKRRKRHQHQQQPRKKLVRRHHPRNLTSSSASDEDEVPHQTTTSLTSFVASNHHSSREEAESDDDVGNPSSRKRFLPDAPRLHRPHHGTNDIIHIRPAAPIPNVQLPPFKSTGLKRPIDYLRDSEQQQQQHQATLTTSSVIVVDDEPDAPVTTLPPPPPSILIDAPIQSIYHHPDPLHALSTLYHLTNDHDTFYDRMCVPILVSHWNRKPAKRFCLEWSRGRIGPLLAVCYDVCCDLFRSRALSTATWQAVKQTSSSPSWWSIINTIVFHWLSHSRLSMSRPLDKSQLMRCLASDSPPQVLLLALLTPDTVSTFRTPEAFLHEWTEQSWSLLNTLSVAGEPHNWMLVDELLSKGMPPSPNTPAMQRWRTEYHDMSKHITTLTSRIQSLYLKWGDTVLRTDAALLWPWTCRPDVDIATANDPIYGLLTFELKLHCASPGRILKIAHAMLTAIQTCKPVTCTQICRAMKLLVCCCEAMPKSKMAETQVLNSIHECCNLVMQHTNWFACSDTLEVLDCLQIQLSMITHRMLLLPSDVVRDDVCEAYGCGDKLPPGLLLRLDDNTAQPGDALIHVLVCLRISLTTEQQQPHDTKRWNSCMRRALAVARGSPLFLSHSHVLLPIGNAILGNNAVFQMFPELAKDCVGLFLHVLTLPEAPCSASDVAILLQEPKPRVTHALLCQSMTFASEDELFVKMDEMRTERHQYCAHVKAHVAFGPESMATEKITMLRTFAKQIVPFLKQHLLLPRLAVHWLSTCMPNFLEDGALSIACMAGRTFALLDGHHNHNTRQTIWDAFNPLTSMWSCKNDKVIHGRHSRRINVIPCTFFVGVLEVYCRFWLAVNHQDDVNGLIIPSWIEVIPMAWFKAVLVADVIHADELRNVALQYGALVDDAAAVLESLYCLEDLIKYGCKAGGVWIRRYLFNASLTHVLESTVTATDSLEGDVGRCARTLVRALHCVSGTTAAGALIHDPSDANRCFLISMATFLAKLPLTIMDVDLLALEIFQCLVCDLTSAGVRLSMLGFNCARNLLDKCNRAVQGHCPPPRHATAVLEFLATIHHPSGSLSAAVMDGIRQWCNTSIV